jgi:hypothetical protein
VTDNSFTESTYMNGHIYLEKTNAEKQVIYEYGNLSKVFDIQPKLSILKNAV